MNSCNSCRSPVEHLLDFGDQPIVNKLMDHANESAALYRRRVAGCTRCGLVQLTDPIDPSEFYKEYKTPSSWKHEPHVDRLLSYLDSMVPRDARIIEVGCNDGRFLDRLKDMGWTNLDGLEPTANTSAAAAQKGHTIFHQGLNERAASGLVDDNGAWDCVILRQVLEHISDLNDFGNALHGLLREQGLLVIEVPDSRNNFDGLDYALWEEHVNCFTPKTLDRFLIRHGFRTIHSYTSVFSGVCLTAIARKVANVEHSVTQPAREDHEALQSEISQFRAWSAEFPAFQKAVHLEIQRYAELGDVVIFGVGSRSSNFINMLELGPYVAYAVDDRREKQHKYMPYSGLKIYPANEMASRIHRPHLVLLGVNGENEEAVLNSSEFPRDVDHFSVLPPSPRLLGAWDRRRIR